MRLNHQLSLGIFPSTVPHSTDAGRVKSLTFVRCFVQPRTDIADILPDNVDYSDYACGTKQQKDDNYFTSFSLTY